VEKNLALKGGGLQNARDHITEIAASGSKPEKQSQGRKVSSTGVKDVDGPKSTRGGEIIQQPSEV